MRDAATRSAEIHMVEHYPPGFRRRRFRNWFFLGLLYAGFYLCRYNLSTVTPEIAREYGYNNAQTGMMSTGRDVGYAAGQFVNGLFADALGGRASMAIGAIGTIVLNLFFVYAAGWQADAAFLLTAFFLIRTLDGYAQSFGSPGMVKINAAWFKRRERGTFAGIFGMMIQIGQMSANWLSSGALSGKLALVGVTLLAFAPLNWRSMFIIPPIVLSVLLVLMLLNVKNRPDEAGLQFDSETDGEDPAKPRADVAAEPKLRLWVVFLRIGSNPLIWLNAVAYLCTGFVRRAYDFWWAKYLDNAWEIKKGSAAFEWMGWLLPIAAVVGSFGAGYISDRFFQSRRSPVAALLYSFEAFVIVLAAMILMTPGLASPVVACTFLVLISLTCNTSHSIIGTAAVMDIGGRRMAGFALGVVNSFQYIGTTMAGWWLGGLIDQYKWNALFWAMLPFSVLGAVIMGLLWWRTRGRDVRGA